MKTILAVTGPVIAVSMTVALLQMPVYGPDIIVTKSGYLLLAIIFSLVAAPMFMAGVHLLVNGSPPPLLVSLASGAYALASLGTFFLLPYSVVGNLGILGLLLLMLIYTVVFNLIVRHVSTKDVI